MKKLTIIGGGGIRTPLVIHGLAQAQTVLGVAEVALYDTDPGRAALVAALGREVVRQAGAEITITTPVRLEEAVDGAQFILHSVRTGGIAARARDERLAIDHGIAGQETTGLGGLAMALRTIPVALEHAGLIERCAPEAWLISFTNPAGLMTQALRAHTRLRVIGICDTPSEMFFRIALALNQGLEDVECDYFGLNHLGWVQRVLVRGQDVTDRLLNDDAALRSLFHAELFEPAMIRGLGLIPSEYLFFYYARQRALANQRTAGACRGEEIAQLNAVLFSELQREVSAGRFQQALAIYRDYLRRRSGSYMKLEAGADTALREGVEQDEDPFEAATGYHRIALDVTAALVSGQAARIVLNVSNRGAITDLATDDVVEVPCLIDQHGPLPQAFGRLPQAVCGLVQAVKEYEHLTVRAAVEKSRSLAKLALLTNPLIGEWEPASKLTDLLIKSDPEHLGYLQ
jgi:6-phospho-beta-glucosidase